MRRQIPRLVAVALVLLAAGVAAAQSLLVGGSPGLVGGSPGLTVNGTTGNGTTVAQSTPSTTTSGPSTGVPGTATTTGPSTGGASSTTTPATTTPTTTGTTANAPAIDQIVSFTRTVAAGTAALSVFAVPAGQQLIVTDVLITNPATTPACGAAISAAGATTTTPAPTSTTTPSATPTATPAATTIEAGTGLLCVPAQTSLNLGLTTGLEFAAGQSVTLANTATSPLHYHLRGFLVSPGA
jgi:hypothetical protein